MAIDRQIELAIREAVQNQDQSEKVANKLIKWLENAMEGNENLHDEGSYSRHLELIYDDMISTDEES